MTAKPESRFGHDIMNNLRGVFWSRIENRHGGGIPDIYGIKEKSAFWLELKCIKQNSIKLSPLQISWNYNNFRHGGKNFYMVKDTRFKVVKLYDGDQGTKLLEQGFAFQDYRLIMRPPYNWEELEKFLIN